MENLCIPHIEMERRMFVLEPLCQIAPYAVHPVSGRRVQELRQALSLEGDWEDKSRIEGTEKNSTNARKGF